MIVVAGLRAAATIFIPFLVAFFLGILSFPLLFWLRKRMVPAPLAILLTMMSVVGVLVGLGLFLSASFNGIASAAPRYQERLRELVTPQLERLQGMGVDLSDWADSELLDLGRLIDLARGTFLGVATAASLMILVLLFLVFILAETVGFRTKLARALGADNHVLVRFGKINREVQRYLGIKTAISLLTGSVVGLVTFLLGLDFPLFWGFIAFVFNYVPNLGSVMAAVPAVLLAYLQDGPGRALVLALCYLTINIGIGNLLEPTLMGRKLRLSPLVVLLSLVFWGWVWGPVGMILAVPLTMILKIMLENTEDLRWLAELLAQSPRAEAGAPHLRG